MFIRKKQKITSKKQNQRAYRGFITKVKWWRKNIDDILLISNIYESEYQKKEILVHKLPLWRNVTSIQRLAYFFYFMAETKDFTSLKPFTLDFSQPFRDKYKHLTYKQLKAVISKRMYGNLDYIFKSSLKPMMSFILENKPKNKRKDINDKGTHLHGIREVFNEDIDCKVRLALKTSVCNGKKEYKEPKYKNMLHTSKKYASHQYGAAGWMLYLNKGVNSNNGLYISDSLLRKIQNDYTLLYKRHNDIINELKKSGVKVKYIKPNTL